MCAAIPTRDRDTGEARILKAGTINDNRRLQLLEPVKRSLYDDDTDIEDTGIFWHILDIKSSDRPPMIIISDDLQDGPHIDDTWEHSTVLEDGRYIRPPNAIVEKAAGSYEKGEQTIAAFVAQILRMEEDELRDAYSPDHSFFRSKDEYRALLDETIPRYVFYASNEYQSDARKVDYYFLMSQEAFSYSSRETRELMLVHGNILEDDRIFVVLDELERGGQFSFDMSLFG